MSNSNRYRPSQPKELSLSPRSKFATSALVVFVVTAVCAYAVDRLILKLAEEHQAASPQLAMAAAMGGLFAGGLVALLAILILARAGSSPS